MEQREIKMALGRHVMCRVPMEGEIKYVLRGVTIRKDECGKYVYFAELLDLPSLDISCDRIIAGRSVTVAPLEDIRLSDEYFRKE